MVAAKLFRSPVVTAVVAVLVDAHLITREIQLKNTDSNLHVRMIRGGGVGGVGGRWRITTGGGGGGAGACRSYF